MSHVMCQVSIFFFLGLSGEVCLFRVCYKRGLPHIVCKHYDPKLGYVLIIIKDYIDIADIFVFMAIVRNTILVTLEHRPTKYLRLSLK